MTRLRRIEGQVRGVERTVGPGDALHCIVEGVAEGKPEELTDELMAAVGRLMRRR
jgi:DNA-binding FrmR family transcriptional regulator